MTLLLIGMLVLGHSVMSFALAGDVELPYSADNIFVKHKDNASIIGDYDSVDIGETRYLILPKSAPSIVNLEIVEEQNWSTHIASVNIDDIKSINGVPIKIVRTELPVVHITTDIDAWREWNKEATLKDTPIDGHIIFEDNIEVDDLAVKITRHGNSSWSLSNKRGYNLKFDNKLNLYGMPKSKSWNLLGVGLDKTLSRDYAARTLASELNYPYITQMKYVTLFINGRYVGVYQLTEKPKKVMERAINPKRGDFAITWLDNDTDYAVPINFNNAEFDEDATYMNSLYEYSCNIEVPDKGSDEDFGEDYYQQKVQELIDSLESGSIEKIDLDTWVKYYWLQEFPMNYDAWYRSAYSFYKADEDKWYQGTIWDYDRSWQYCDNRPTVSFSSFDSTIGTYGLYKDLFQNEEFANAAYNYFYTDIVPAIETTRLDLYKHKEAIQYDGELNYEFWKRDRGLISSYLDEVYGTSFDTAYDSFMQYYENREQYLSDNYDNVFKELTNGKFIK